MDFINITYILLKLYSLFKYIQLPNYSDLILIYFQSWID